MGCIYLILQVLFNSFYGITVGLVILIYILFFASLLTMSIGTGVIAAVTFQQVKEFHSRFSFMETFFRRLKNEMFYGFEKDYPSFQAFSKAIVEYIDYYNNSRIQAKTKWMPPLYRKSRN